MKNKIYAISLLLSFLSVLSHEIIVHHHHDVLALDFSVNNEHDADYEHKHLLDKENQHNNDSQEEEKSSECNHPCFFHQHFSATNDLNIERKKLLESNTQVRKFALLIFTELFIGEFLKPPKLGGYLYGQPPFLISSLCKLEANALRGPPSIV
jgi:hypothetical protein